MFNKKTKKAIIFIILFTVIAIIAVVAGILIYIFYFKKITVTRPPDGSCKNAHDNKTITDFDRTIAQ